MGIWIQLSIVILTLGFNTFADDSRTSEENSVTDIARLWIAGLDSPSMHWPEVVNLSEILNMLDANEWNTTEEHLKHKWKEFLADHKDALELYQQLQEISQESTNRRLLSTESAVTANEDADNWMQTWMQSFSSLIKDAVQGNSADSSSIVETLRTQLLTESMDPNSVSEISHLFKSLLEELTYQPEERQEPTDVWGRMEQAMREVQTLQRKAMLARSVLEAIEAYSSCRGDLSVITVVSCLNSLTDALETLVSQYDAESYNSQRSETEDSTLLSSFRADIEASMTAFTICQEYKNLNRISCLGDWWRSVLEMERKYSGMDSSTLSPADASLVELLKKMLSLERYVSGTNPEMKTESRDEEKLTLREFISSAINRHKTNAEDNVNAETSLSETVRKITSSLRDFISNIGVFSRVGSTTPSRSSGIKRRLLSEGEEASPILAYLQDLNQISQTIRTVLEYRNRMTQSAGQQTVADRLQRLLALPSPSQDSTSSSTGTLSSDFGRRAAAYVLDRIFDQDSEQETAMRSVVRRFIEQRISERQSRRLLMTDPQLDQLHIQSTDGNKTYEASLDHLERAFREKATKSLETLGEVRAITRRRLHQSDQESIKTFLDDIRPHREELRRQSDTHHQSLRSSTKTKPSSALHQILRKQETKEASSGVRYMGELIGQTISEAQGGQSMDQTVNRNELAMLDAILRRHFGLSLSEIIADAVATTRQVFKATSGIIAHDLHDHSDRDGMPHERVHLTDVPNESFEILSQVGRTAASLSKVQETVRNYTTKDSSARNHAKSHRHRTKSGKVGDSSRALLASYPDQGQPTVVTRSFAAQTHDTEAPETEFDLYYNPPDQGERVAEDAFFSDELVPLFSEPTDIQMPRTEFLMSVLTPQLHGVSADDFVDVYELENPNWWKGRTLHVPEAQHLDYEFDFESQDEEAPVHKGLGALMKYHLWQDMNPGETKGNSKDFTMIEFIVFFAGIWTGLFIAFISLGVVLLNRALSRRAMDENSYLTDAEARSALLPGNLSKMHTVGLPKKSDLSIKAAA